MSAPAQRPQPPSLDRIHAPSAAYLHEAIRRECNDEQNLVSNRIGWLIGIQGFLFTAYSVSVGHDPAVGIWWFTHLALPALGIAMALLGYTAIGNALASMHGWQAQERAFHARYPGYDLLRIEGDDHQHGQIRGMRFARLVPVVLGAAWLLMLGHGVLEYAGRTTGA